MHRRLLEEKVEELKVGAVLLLKQVTLPPPPFPPALFKSGFTSVRLLPV